MKGNSPARRILITGASGFIGRYLIKYISEEGYTIRATDILPPREMPEGVEFVQGDLASIEFAREITQELDGVIHLAAISRVSAARKNPAACISTNVLGTAALLQALYEDNNEPWFILVSTREVDEVLKSDMPFELDDIYAISKRAAEEIARCFFRSYNSRLFIFRLSDVYGELPSGDSPPKVLSIFLMRALQNLTIDVYLPDMVFHFSHITDVVNALWEGVKEIQRIETGFEIRRVWPDQGITLLDLAQLICKLTGSCSEIRTEPKLNCSSNSPKSGSEENNTKYRFSQKITLEHGLRCLITDMNKLSIITRGKLRSE